MKTIWKFVLDPHNLKLEMPLEAKILAVKEQRNQICLWVQVDTDAPKSMRYFSVFGTGHDLKFDGLALNQRYIGTVMFHEGDLVFHVYERFVQ